MLVVNGRKDGSLFVEDQNAKNEKTEIRIDFEGTSGPEKFLMRLAAYAKKM